MSTPSFIDLGLPASLVRVLAQRDITVPTSIQAATLADTLAGRDVLGRGRTGSGKTYAFLLPLVARLSVAKARARSRPRSPRALVLAPTRELVGQIEAALAPLARAAGLSSVSIFGGVSQRPQVHALRSGVDIVLACPGRLEDLNHLLERQVLVILGATAAKALLGSKFRLTANRGKPIESDLAPYVTATIHPSAILRAPDDEARQRERRAFTEDLRTVLAKLP